jgi:hypothetical protein
MAKEAPVGALVALDAYTSMRRMNLQLCRGLTGQQKQRVFTHPEFGEIDVAWLMEWCAGHERHHLPQFEAIGKL